MVIPTIKTLIVYNHDGGEKRVLSDLFEDKHSKYGYLEYQRELESKNPFEINRGNSEISQKSDTLYEIGFYEGVNKVASVKVNVVSVLEFQGRIFELKETTYDLHEDDL